MMLVRAYFPKFYALMVPLAFGGSLVGWCGGQEPALDPAAPTVLLKAAVEVSLPTVAGKVYQWQTSADLVTWEKHGGLVFGTGEPLCHANACGACQFFRLQVLTAPVMGDAPWSAEGSSLQLNEGTSTMVYAFQANHAGTTRLLSAGNTSPASSTPVPFTWKWLRDGLTHVRLEVTRPTATPPDATAITREIIHLTYVAARAGQFTRRAFIGTRLDQSAAGSFGPLPAANSSTVPSSLIGRTIAFSESPGGSALTIASAMTGQRLIDSQAMPFTGTWLVTGSNTARLTTSFTATHGEDYRFTFTSPLTGRFSRQTYTEGIFRDDDQGNFCLNIAP